MSSTVFVLYQGTPLQRARLQKLHGLLPIHLVEVVRHSAHYDWGDGLSEPDYPLEILFDAPPGNSVAEAAAVTRALERIRPDTVFVLGYARQFARAVSRYALKTGVPSVLISDSTPREGRTGWVAAFIKRLIVGGHNSAFVAGTPQARHMAWLGMPPERIFIGYDVVDNDYIAAAADAGREGRPQVAPFLCVSRLVWQKNLHRLIDAFAAFARAVPDSRRALHIAGYGPLREQLEDHIKSVGLEGRVVLLGGVPYEEMPLRYAHAAAFILASHSEPWGLVVNEAMAAGLPVAISAAAGCVEDLVKHGHNGYVFEPEDVPAMTRAITALDRDANMRTVMSRESRAIISKWTLDSFAAGAVAAVAAAHENHIPVTRKLKAHAALLTLSLRSDRVRGFEDEIG